jgi:succinate dehydrogenase / fumarate reductase, membrane anchor subunit
MKSFSRHYLWQRITACILLVLVPWFLWNVFSIKGLPHNEVVHHFGNLFSVGLLFLMIVSGFYHGYLGIQTICLDYLPNPKVRCFINIFIGTVFSLLSIFGTFCLIRLVALGHG